MSITHTTGQLHFEDLSFDRFEELMFGIIHGLRKWKKVRHFGKTGDDDGVDIEAVAFNGKKYHYQCKRHKTMNKSTLQAIIDDYLKNNNNSVPYEYTILLSCPLSKKVTEYIENYADAKGFENFDIWDKSRVEAVLYENYRPLLQTFFGISFRNLISPFDKRNAEHIISVFDNQNLKYYLTEVDLSDDFDNDVFAPLLDLYYAYNNNPHMQFLDKHLSKVVYRLFITIRCFFEFKAINTFSTNLGTQALKTWRNNDYNEEEKRELSKCFHDRAEAVWNDYCEFVKIYHLIG